jgi:hypothetical protein
MSADCHRSDIGLSPRPARRRRHIGYDLGDEPQVSVPRPLVSIEVGMKKIDERLIEFRLDKGQNLIPEK